MSMKLMSAIFETEFTDLKDEAGNVTKASTAKFVLLAMADHANDEGEGAYPSIERLCKKTALSEQTIRNTFDALRHNGIIFLTGKSKYGTNNHTINTKSFPEAIGKEVAYLTLHPLDPLTSGIKGSNQSPQGGNSLDPNHPLITIKPSNDDEDDTKLVRQLYEDNIGVVNPLMLGLIRNASHTYPCAWFHPAFELAAKINARCWRYVETILEAWRNYGFGWKPERLKPQTKRVNDNISFLQNYIGEHHGE